jgi:hypothetical protein
MNRQADSSWRCVSNDAISALCSAAASSASSSSGSWRGHRRPSHRH